MTDAVHSIYFWLGGAITQRAVWNSSFFLVVCLLGFTFRLCSEDRVMNFLMVSPAVLMSTSQKIPVQENFLLWYDLTASHGTLPESFTGTDSREARTGNLGFGSIRLQMEVCVLHSCRKHSGCLHSLVQVPAICSSPFAAPVLIILSVSSTMLDVFPVSRLPLAAPFLSRPD